MIIETVLDYCLIITIMIYLKANLTGRVTRAIANVVTALYIAVVIGAIILQFTRVRDLYATSPNVYLCTAAGIVKCFVLGLAILVNLLNLLSLITNATAAIGTLLSGFTEFAGWAAAIFMIIGLFMHSRKSKPLCIVGAILALAASLGQQTFSIIRYVTRADFSKLISGLSFSAAISLTTACVAAAAWILLGVYFGAQNTEQE